MSESQCFTCGKIFHDKSSLRQHKYSVHSTTELTCKQCNKILIGKKKLIGHMESHKKIICPFCEKSIPKNSRLNHKCSNSERFLCELCPYESSRKDMLKRHMKTHNKKPKEVIKHNCMFTNILSPLPSPSYVLKEIKTLNLTSVILNIIFV